MIQTKTLPAVTQVVVSSELTQESCSEPFRCLGFLYLDCNRAFRQVLKEVLD